MGCVVPENIRTPPPPHEGCLGLSPPSSGNSSLGSYFPSKIYNWPLRPSSHSEFPTTLPVVGVWIFSGTT